jgi:hypothetical protein
LVAGLVHLLYDENPDQHFLLLTAARKVHKLTLLCNTNNNNNNNNDNNDRRMDREARVDCATR